MSKRAGSITRRRRARFIAKTDHVAFHDKRLWDLRRSAMRRRTASPEWETLRELASGIKEHTLSHLADYLEQFVDAGRAEWRRRAFRGDAEEHNAIVHKLMSERGMTTLVKSKSMLTDECKMREYLEPRGITVMETDLGERIQQLDHQDPSHMVVPAVHKLRADVAELFGRTIGTDPAEQRHPLSRRKPAHEHAAVLRARENGRHDGLQFRGGGDGDGGGLHERGQCGPVGECAAAAYRVDRHREADSEGRRPRRVHPACCRAARSARRSRSTRRTSARRVRARRCTTSSSITAAPSASRWTTSGTRSSASAAARA